MKSVYYIAGGIGVAILIYIIYKNKTAIERTAIISVDDLIFNSGATSNVYTSDGAYNNPCNIELNSANDWLGLVDGNSTRFCSFTSLAYGYRAFCKLVQNLYTQGNTTLTTLMNAYAPPSDNNPTTSYISYLSDQIGIDPNADLYSTLYSSEIVNLALAVSNFEQGSGFTAQAGVTQSATQGYNLLA